MADEVSSVISAKKLHLVALDGLRGVAAFSVLLLHWFEGNGSGLFHYSLMAVDFFFLLSGFVIAYSYEDRLRNGLPLRTFFVSRLVRLYPMIFIGILLGLMRALFRQGGAGSGFNMAEWVGATIMNLLMVPTFDSQSNILICSFNIAMWSLFFEFIAYFLYATVYVRRGKWLLALTIAAAVPGVIGWIYVAFDKTPGIFALPLFESSLTQCLSRLLCFYFLGLWLFRNQEKLAFIPGVAFPVLAGFSTLLFAMPVHAFPPPVNCLIMIAVLPAMVLSASRTVMEARTKAIGAFLGDLSYPLYVVHTPAMWILSGVLKHLRPGVAPILWGVFVVPAVAVLAWFSLRVYDAPIRSWLTRKWIQKLPRTRVTNEFSPVLPK